MASIATRTKDELSATGYLTRMRKFGFGGNTWTFVLGGLCYATYYGYKNRTESRQTPFDNVDPKTGEEIFSKKRSYYDPTTEKTKDYIQQCKDFINANPQVSGGMAVFFAVGAFGFRARDAYHRLMINRHDDVLYQFRLQRNDFRKVKMMAFRYLVLPGLFVPAISIFAIWQWKKQVSTAEGLISSDFDTWARENITSLIQNGREITKEPLDSMKEWPIAKFARNMKEINPENNIQDNDLLRLIGIHHGGVPDAPRSISSHEKVFEEDHETDVISERK